MQLSLSARCPIFEPSNERHLFRLLDAIVRGWHVLATPYPEELEKLIAPSTWAVYGDMLTQNFKLATRSFTALQQPNNCESCNAEALSHFLNMRTVLLVENPRSDGGFIKAVVHRLRPRMKSMFSQPDQVVDIRHGGGITEIPAEIERLSAEYVGIRPEGIPPRFVVVVDSDSKQAGRPSAEARLVQRAAAQARVEAHILAKRSIENYIPDEALVEYAAVRTQHIAAVGVIASLTGEARDHYPMKTGLGPDILKSTEVESLYPPNLPRGAGMSNFVTDFLTISERHLTRHGLRQRDAGGDLELLLDLLEGNA